MDEAEADNLGDKVQIERWARWCKCSLCEQHYHGIVRCALGWACWKTYVGRPETDTARKCATSLLGLGLYEAEHYEDALSVQETLLATLRRIGGGSGHNMFVMQGNLAMTYEKLGRLDQALQMKRDAFLGFLKLYGEEHSETLREANNYVALLLRLERYGEASKLLRKLMPVARRVLGDGKETTLRMSWNYARALCEDIGATLDDLRAAVTTLEDATSIARRVLGSAHPVARGIEIGLEESRAVLRARETPSTSA